MFPVAGSKSQWGNNNDNAISVTTNKKNSQITQTNTQLNYNVNINNINTTRNINRKNNDFIDIIELNSRQVKHINRLKKKVDKSLQELHDIRNIQYQDEVPSNDPWGDYPVQRTALCRIAFQNIIGINPTGGYAKVHMIGIESNYKNIDILGLAETNIDWSYYKDTKEKCKNIIRQ